MIFRSAGAAASYSLRCVFGSPNSCCGSNFGARTISTNAGGESAPSLSTLPSRISPWLMLPPAFIGGGDMVYKFYSLAENRVLNFNKRHGEESSVELPDDDAKFVGSSHGWLALFNQRNNDLFLSNPISGKHIKLPPVDTLPDPHINLRNGHGRVSKVIISRSPCTPDVKECRAVMTFGPGNRLACCYPGHSEAWTPMGDLFSPHKEPYIEYAVVYEDFGYRSGHEIFTCIADFEMDLDEWELDEMPRAADPIMFEEWCIHDPCSPTLDDTRFLRFGGEKPSWWKENMALLKKCMQIPYLVYSGEEYEEQLFLVVRHEDGWGFMLKIMLRS